MIPEGWSKKAIGDLLIEHREKSTRQDQFEVLTSSRNGLMPQSEYYSGGRINVRDNIGFHVVPPDHVTYRSRSDDGDFYFNLNNSGMTGLVSHFYPVFKFKDGDVEFFVELLNYHRSQIGTHSVGSSQRVLSLNALKKIQFNLPPLKERCQIVEIFKTWDRAIEAGEALIANARAQKLALMQQLLTGKRRLAGFTGDWGCVPLGDLAELMAGGTPSTTRPDYWGGAIPWMSSGEINLGEIYSVEGRISEAGLKGSSAKMLPINTVLIALAGQGATRGKTAISRIPLCTNQSVAAIVPSSRLSPEYLYCNLSFRYEELRSLSLGDGGRGGLNLGVLKRVQIPLPFYEEQSAIALALRSADRHIQLNVVRQNALRQEKAALRQQLLTGKRRVRLPESEVV